MARGTLNLGIVAHVDAGKTTLTERLLFAAGVIDEVGSVDDGTTQTDSLALERQRGITIKSAVVSFTVGDVTVNLIDTPGHPDFIAEVERALSVLDGAVLVISAVEGVQPQTRILMRALQRLRVPALLFVNKIDRRGADDARLLRDISERLTPAIVAMGSARDAGHPRGRLHLLGRRRHGLYGPPDRGARRARRGDAGRLRPGRAGSHTGGCAGNWPGRPGRGQVYPVFFGSALTGAGVDALMSGVAELLPTAGRDAAGPASGRVFKIERGPAGEKIAYVRMFSGTVRTRDAAGPGRATEGDRDQRLRGRLGRPAGVAVGRADREAVGPGRDQGRRRGRHGDRRGTTGRRAERHQFAPPTLETVVMPRDPRERGALRAALAQLAEQDPLINVRQDDLRQEISVSLFGEVQKEVIAATLAADFNLEVSFRETTTICIERLAGPGAAVERLHQATNPFLAAIGLRVCPTAAGSGVTFRLEVELGSMPLAFFRATEDTVRETLRQGLRGWDVPDCTVAMTHSGYLAKQSSGHQRFDKSMSSTGEDYRKLTPLVLASALRRAGTVVCEPVHRFRLTRRPTP